MRLLGVSAQEQGEQQRKLDALKAEVERRDNDIRTLQKSLKEAETILVSVGRDIQDTNSGCPRRSYKVLQSLIKSYICFIHL